MRNRRGQAKRKPEDTGYHEPGNMGATSHKTRRADSSRGAGARQPVRLKMLAGRRRTNRVGKDGSAGEHQVNARGIRKLE